MLEIYACTAALCGASLALGAAILRVCGAARPYWLSGAVGLAALVALAALLIRLPGRATTAAVGIGLVLAASFVVLWRGREGGAAPWTGIAAGLAATGLASLPFFFQDHIGVLGEGIYINDHAAQLYWADWLRHGIGPEPKAVTFGYPIGPQALVAAFVSATGADLVAAFNGLLLAIPALTAVAAIAALDRLAAPVRVLAATLPAVCFLAASFLAQSAFKETAMALFVLAFALALQVLRGRALVVAGIVLAAGTVFTYSLPGLAWFAGALPLWLALEAATGRSPVDFGALRGVASRHRTSALVGGGLVVVAVVVAVGPALNFVDRIDEVQGSLGRLGSPIFPGEVFGIWPEGDFRIVRGEVSGSLLAAGIGGLAALFGVWVLWRRRELALLAMLITGAVVYVGVRVVAEIHVQAKALAVIAPLVLLVGLRGLLARRDDGEGDGVAYARWAAGALVALAALGSSFVALRAAPVGFDERGQALERFADRIGEDTVVFLGIDRFGGYYLRGTLARAPGGYVPEAVGARLDKPWLQGYAVDFDNLMANKLDQFNWAITTASSFNSAPPPNFERVAEDSGYVLWRRNGRTPQTRIVGSPAPLETPPVTPEYETNSPGARFDCDDPVHRRLVARGGVATVRPEPVHLPPEGWEGERLDPAAGGQEHGFTAQAPVSRPLGGEEGERVELSLQYHSQVPLTVSYDGEVVGELPPSLAGMYFKGAGRGAFWPVGQIELVPDGVLEVTPHAPEGLRASLGVRAAVWLGEVAGVPLAEPEEVPLEQACGRYVDHFTVNKGVPQ